MLKVFLVEDEFIVREGIKNNVRWKENGYEFCGEASDGELAFPMIQERKPDIVITDIRMPFMDGLELSRMLREAMPHVKIIILSGYGEFEYAKEAIAIGVQEYLLKPINSGELLAAVGKVAEKIEEERKEEKIREKFRKEMKENEIEARRSLFQEIVGGKKSLADLLEKGRRLGLNLSASWYHLLLVKVTLQTYMEEVFSSSLVQIEEKITHSLETMEKVIVFDRNLEGRAVLLLGVSQEEVCQLQEHIVSLIHDTAEKYKDVRYFGGIGQPVNRLRELPMAFSEANRAFAYRFLVDGSRFVDSSSFGDSMKIQELDWKKKQDFQVGAVDINQLDKSRVDNFLRSGESSEVDFFVEEYLRNIGSAGESSIIFRQYIVMDMYFAATKFLEELKIPPDRKEPFQSPEQMKAIISSLSETVHYVKDLFFYVIKQRDEISRKKNAGIVTEVCQYMEQHYGDEDLSLNKAASHVNISPNYLSMVFSQEKEQTFVKYLTDYRMNRAKELLKCTNKRSSEISLEVGYRDSHYFSYLFKKTQGMTPTQYRNGGSKKEG